MNRNRTGLLVGLLSAGVALGVGEIAAAFVRSAAAPVIAVGNRVVVLTPEPVKRWAIRTFQASDKQVLLLGIYVLLALFAAGVGLLAVRRLVYGLSGVAVFGGFAAYCSLSANAARGTDVVPTVIGTLAAAAAMVLLVRLAGHDRAAAETPPGLDRRLFVRGGVATAGVAAAAGLGGRALATARFSVAGTREHVSLPPPAEPAPPLAPTPDLGKSPVPWQTPNDAFYRVDTALTVPQIDPKDWALRVHGMVDRPVTLRFQDVLARPLIERWITLCCVSNDVGGGLIGNARFLGAALADLLREAGLHAGADQLLMTSQDGMTIGAPTAVVMDGRDALLAVGMNGVPLPLAHGFPVRVVVPGLYGYVSACKWVVDIEATTFGTRAYWVQGGWAARTDIKLASRIDTPRPGKTVAAGRTVAIAGVAWDQHVGVSAVEVRVDDGAWQRARLAPVPSTDTWRQWVLPWTPPHAGSYRLTVRATAADGTPQDTRQRAPFPSGATGLHTIAVRAR